MELLGTKFWLFSLFLFTSIFMNKGDVHLELEPDYPEKGDPVILTCTASQAVEAERDSSACSLWWTRTSFPARTMSKEPVVDSTNTKIKTIRGTGANSHRITSTLMIKHMNDNMKGQYSCSYWCPRSLESADIELKYYGSIYGAGKDSLIGAFIVVVSILVILVGSFCLAILDCCNKKTGHHQQQQYVQSNSQSSLDTENSDLDRLYTDSPPRYSLVVETSGQNESHDPEAEVSSFISRVISNSSSINSVFVLPTPPPDYAQAILDLSERGIFFSRDDIGPMPPSYREVTTTSEPKEV